MEQRSLKYLRDRGYFADQVNRRIAQPFAGAPSFTKDAFGFIDVLAFSEDDPGFLAVQVTSVKQVSKHIRDYRRDPKKREAILACMNHNTVVIHAWEAVEVATKRGAKTPYKTVWTVVERRLKPSDMEMKPGDL